MEVNDALLGRLGIEVDDAGRDLTICQLGEEMQLSKDDQRRVLLLSPQEWADWSEFVDDGALPAQPQLPVMLRRLGNASHRLAVLADRRGAQA